MNDQPSIDGKLQEWGTRLFYPQPKKPRPGEDAGRLLRTAGGAIVARVLLDPNVVRSRLRALVHPRARQVVVKITGGRGTSAGRGMKAIAANFRYISRVSQPEVGGRGQTLTMEDENGQKISGREALEALTDDWRMAGSLIPEVSHRKEAFNVILSMPPGTPKDPVFGAARDFARETFKGHKYVFVLHTDTPWPHVHLTIRAERSDGRRLNPRKGDLARWRQCFADRLQDHGVPAVTTAAWTRGVEKLPTPLWRKYAAQEKRLRFQPPTTLSEKSIRRRRQAAIELWQGLGVALSQSPRREDRELSLEVVAYARRQFGVPPPSRNPGDDLRPRPEHPPGWHY